MAENQAPGFEKDAELGEKGDKFQNRGYWGYIKGEEGEDGDEEGWGGVVAGCGAGG